MGKALIIAEKPSVARDIAAALGGFKKGEDNTYERHDAVISSAIGHLVTIALPEGTDKGWNLDVLPVIPEQFALEPIKQTSAQLKVLSKLMRRPDIDTVVNACDAGREGELIFRLIYNIAGCKKAIKRMWLQSMTHDAISDAHKNMRTGQQMQPLYDAAMCRSEADFLVGVNGTRALTKLWERISPAEEGKKNVASCGRVQSPTLALLYHRELAIRNFVPRDFYEVHGTFKAAAGNFMGKWFDPSFKKTDDDAQKADRLFDQAKARAIEAKCAGHDPSSVTDDSKATTSAPPKLFDLTALQREANTKFGFSAKQTLDIAQALYETHKVLTYPRTDASALPEDYVETAKKTLAALAGTKFAEHAALPNQKGWVKPDKRIFNNAKISDHFAIIPNGNKPGSLSPEESKIYDLVTKRFIAAFYPPAEYLQTTRITVVEGESFKSQGSILVSEGWRAVYGVEASDDKEASGSSLCAVAQGEKVRTESIKTKGAATTAPERYTEATLLGAMEHAGRTVEDEEAAEALKEHGLGTPATRAATIEDLLSAGKSYVRRDKKFLVPTDKAMQVIALLLNNGIESLTSAQMTGEWEHKLSQMEQGKLSRKSFMEEVKAMTTRIVDQIRQKAFTLPAGERQGGGGNEKQEALSASCPKCKKGTVAANGKAFACQSCDFKLWREVATRTITAKEAETLLTKGETGTLDGFYSPSSKKKFSAKLKLSENFDKVNFEFDNTPADPSTKPSVGRCPKCNTGVVVDGGKYSCGSSDCTFSMWRKIAGKELSESAVKKLLATKQTDVIKGFISTKTGKPFDARLQLADNGDVKFDFSDVAPAQKKSNKVDEYGPR